MIIDNFEIIRKHLIFDSDNDADWFYHIQILIRRKDEGTTIKKNCKLVHSYYIRSLQQFDDLKEQIVTMCKMFHARAYIRLNPASWKKCTLMAFEELATYFRSNQFSSLRGLVDTLIGKYTADGCNKTWIVDIDEKDISIVNNVRECITNCMPNKGENKCIELIPTKNGYHLISKPFNVQEFNKVYPDIDIHKNNPTLLYFNDEFNKD